jgi:uncharacterized protein
MPGNGRSRWDARPGARQHVVCCQAIAWNGRRGGNMPWRRIGVPVAVIVACLIVLGRASDFVVDWAWFSTIGYVDVFWTIFATKAALFIAVFAVSTSLLWTNGVISLRFAWQRRLRLSAVRDPGLATVLALPGTPTGLFGPASPLLPWRLLILAVSLVIGLLIAMGRSVNGT